MRLILGMVLGILLTLLVAYIHDNQVGPLPPSAAEQRTMVNWNVVGENWNSVMARIREQWTKLTAS